MLERDDLACVAADVREAGKRRLLEAGLTGGTAAEVGDQSMLARG